MIELLIMIFIGVTIYKRVQRAKGEGGKGNGSLPNTTVSTAGRDNSSGRVPTFQDRSAGAGSSVRPQAQTQSNKPVKSAINEAKKDGNSTTAYLMEKAEADAREHAKEKYEEQKRLHETRGGLAVAERYLDGDIIPQNKRCISCGYCGAENLVPMIPRTRYSCYFCREPL